MKLNQKRGISDVVTTVLMILLVIAAIGILWAVVQRFVSQGASNLPGTSECLTTVLTVSSATNQSGLLTVKVLRSGTNSGNLTGLKFLLDGSNVQMSGTTPEIGETQQFTNSTTLPGSATIVGREVKVAAMIGTKVCDASEALVVTKA